MSYCTSCGSSIPDDQGKSCSMCYGDPHYGRDGYYLKWIEQQQEKKQRYVCEEPPPHKDDF